MIMIRYNLKINGKIIAVADRYCIMSVAEDLISAGVQNWSIEFRDILKLDERPEPKQEVH